MEQSIGQAVRTVKVMCVWPPERGPKDDCRNRTGVVWAGHGDVQDYPAHLWPKLAEHPDVWKLHDPEADARIAAARQRAAQAQAEARAAIEEAERIARMEEQRLAQAALDAAARGQETGTDVVTITSVNKPGDTAESGTANATEPSKASGNPEGPTVDPLTHLFTEEELLTLSVDLVREIAEARKYDLHPRLKPENLIARFLEAQVAGQKVG